MTLNWLSFKMFCKEKPVAWFEAIDQASSKFLGDPLCRDSLGGPNSIGSCSISFNFTLYLLGRFRLGRYADVLLVLSCHPGNTLSCPQLLQLFAHYYIDPQTNTITPFPCWNTQHCRQPSAMSNNISTLDVGYGIQ